MFLCGSTFLFNLLFWNKMSTHFRTYDLTVCQLNYLVHINLQISTGNGRWLCQQCAAIVYTCADKRILSALPAKIYKWICCYTVRSYVRKSVDILLQKGTPQINVSPEGSINIGSPKWFALPCYQFFLSFLVIAIFDHHNLTVARSRGSGGARCGTNITNFI